MASFAAARDLDHLGLLAHRDELMREPIEVEGLVYPIAFIVLHALAYRLIGISTAICAAWEEF